MRGDINPVWIVDDDADDQRFMAAAFDSLQPALATETLDDGQVLLTRLAQAEELPKLIVLDLNMPRLDGFEVLRHLRSRQTYVELPIVVLTTSDLPVDRQRSLALGANAFYTKPLTYQGYQAIARQITAQWSDRLGSMTA